MRVDELQYHVPPRLGMPDVQLELTAEGLVTYGFLGEVISRSRQLDEYTYPAMSSKTNLQ